MAEETRASDGRSGLGDWRRSWSPRPGDLIHLQDAEREGRPFLVSLNGEGRQRIWPLPPDGRAVVIGRSDESDVLVDWDELVSRSHAELARVAGAWFIRDDRMSTNGTRVNGEPVHARRRLADRDTIQVGSTSIGFREPAPTPADKTRAASWPSEVELSRRQRDVLVALARPCLDPQGSGVPASNREIMARLHLGLDGVKGHLRELYLKFGIQDLPQSQKRARLVAMAREMQVIGPHDLG